MSYQTGHKFNMILILKEITERKLIIWQFESSKSLIFALSEISIVKCCPKDIKHLHKDVYVALLEINFKKSEI